MFSSMDAKRYQLNCICCDDNCSSYLCLFACLVYCCKSLWPLATTATYIRMDWMSSDNARTVPSDRYGLCTDIPLPSTTCRPHRRANRTKLWIATYHSSPFLGHYILLTIPLNWRTYINTSRRVHNVIWNVFTIEYVAHSPAADALEDPDRGHCNDEYLVRWKERTRWIRAITCDCIT